jgi:hypothetical protein
MNPDAQAQLDMADMMLNDPDPEVRRTYLAAYGGNVNDSDWAAIEDSENEPPYGDIPRKRRPMTRPKVLYQCATDNDGYPTCQGDRTSCGFGGVCAEIDPPQTPPAVAHKASGYFLMGADQPEDDGDREDPDDDEDPPWFEARYDGTCSGCGGEIIAGATQIRADGMNGWECC